MQKAVIYLFFCWDCIKQFSFMAQMLRLLCSVYNIRSCGWLDSYNTKKDNGLLGLRKSLQFRGRRLMEIKTTLECTNMGTGLSGNESESVDIDDDKSLASQKEEPRSYPPDQWKEHLFSSVVTTDTLHVNDKVIDNDKHMEMLIDEIKRTFRSMEDGEISPSAYDTAWVARVPAIDGSNQPQFPQTLQWILHNQLADGSWGEESVFLACDRILNTLSCIIALTLWNTGEFHVQRGLQFIKRHMEEALGNHTFKAFEMVFPTLFDEAKLLGLELDLNSTFINQIWKKRIAHLKRIPIERLHEKPTTGLYHLEGLRDIVDWKSILKLQSKDGSFLGSPASTACVFLHTGDQKSFEFLSGLLMKFKDHVPCMYPVDICERLRVVDTIERLGIDRHFSKEIKQALDYVFRYWKESGIGFGRECSVPDVDVTATGFRLLRLHGYNVSSDVLKNMKADNVDFSDTSADEQGRGISDMLSLYKCSQIRFPKETVMQEATVAAKDYLAKSLRNPDSSLECTFKKDLRGETEHALAYPWRMSLPRLMARIYMERFSSNDLWIAKTLYQMPYVNDSKYLELAKLDFNKTQASQRKEIEEINRWYSDSGLAQLTYSRQRPVESYFAAAVVMFEAEYAACRIAYTKTAVLAVTLDDVYDSHAFLAEAQLFTEAVKRWDLSLLGSLPSDMKICFLGLYNTINELGAKGRDAQGRDVLFYLRTVWENMLTSMLKEAEWVQTNYVPPLKDYLENGTPTAGMGTIILNSIFFTGVILPDNLLRLLDFRGKFLHLVCLTLRFVNDISTFKDERDRGELTSCIRCYMKEHPGCTEEEALNYFYDLNEAAFSEMNEDLKPGTVPACLRKLRFDNARSVQLFYRNTDGFGMGVDDMKELVRKILFEPVA